MQTFNGGFMKNIFIAQLILLFSLVSYSFAQQNSCEDDSLGLRAEASIQKNGYVTNDCLRIQNGGRCASASIEKNGYVTNDCLRIANKAQDRCAAASIQKNGYVTNDCLRLN